MPSQISQASPQPRIDMRSIDAESGSPVRCTRYTGVARIEFEKEGRFEIRVVSEGDHMSMWIPDSLPYAADDDVTLSVIVTSSLQPVSGGPHTANGPYGVHSATVQLEDDPRGTGARYISLSFVHIHGHGAEVVYDVTALMKLA